MLDADRKSIARLGHGNAIAQPYHHAILPLSSRRDKVTEVRWGIADFRRRFGRDPEGMWLPETALDDETLDVLAQEGMRFTIVAPGQVRSVPNDGHPGRYTTANGRTIALCIYDGDISHGIAFGGLLVDAHVWARRMLARSDRRHTPRDPAHAAVEAGHWEPAPETDGGTRPLTTGEFLAVTSARRARATQDATPAALGRDRWRDVRSPSPIRRDGARASSCSTSRRRAPSRSRTSRPSSRTTPQPRTSRSSSRARGAAPTEWNGGGRTAAAACAAEPNQEWRTPLRDAIASLAEGLHEIYEREATRYFDDPWAVRDAYGEVVATPEKIESWVAESREADTPPADDSTSRRARVPSLPSPQSLLEMERGALRHLHVVRLVLRRYRRARAH